MKDNKYSEKALKQFADLMISKIEMVDDDWKKPWFSLSGGGLPQNIDGREYKGSNMFLLYLLTEMQGYEIPVYLTFNQAKDSGLHILKGAKSFPVIYWNFVVKDSEGNKIPYDEYKLLPKEEQEKYKVTPFMNTYPVFNVEQTNIKEQLPEKWEKLKSKFSAPELKDENGMFRIPLIDNLIQDQKWVCPIKVEQSNSAYYTVQGCYIIIPKKGQFVDGQSFYSILLHEMAHSTGAENLLNRNMKNKFGSKEYAKEELVAELTAATTGSNLGISTCIREENAQYLKSWLSSLKEDPKFIYSILSDVAKASTMINDKVNEMSSSLTLDDKFYMAVIRNDVETLQEMKNSGLIPNEEQLEIIAKSPNSSEIKEIFNQELKDNSIIVEGKNKRLVIDINKEQALLTVNNKDYNVSEPIFSTFKSQNIDIPTDREKWNSVIKGEILKVGNKTLQISKSLDSYTIKVSQLLKQNSLDNQKEL